MDTCAVSKEIDSPNFGILMLHMETVVVITSYAKYYPALTGSNYTDVFAHGSMGFPAGLPEVKSNGIYVVQWRPDMHVYGIVQV